MSTSKSARTVKPIDPLDWTDVGVQRVEHAPATQIFVQSKRRASWMSHGAVRLSVLSHGGKSVVAVLDAGHFLRRGRSRLSGVLHGNGHRSLDDQHSTEKRPARTPLLPRTVNRRRLTVRFRRCLRKSWREWSARPARE